MATKTIDKIETKTKAFIVEAIRDIVSDSDFDLRLTKRAENRLKQAQSKKEKTTPLSEIKKKYY